MDNRLIVRRMLPGGGISWVMPFHISMEGLQAELLCRDEEDYDVMVKYIFLCARKHEVIVVIYAVVSSHAHIAILCENRECAKKYVDDLKKRHSMWHHKKYGANKILERSGAMISEIESVSYARNAFAYIPRNALDNFSGNIADYKWSGFRGMFCGGQVKVPVRNVSELSMTEARKLFHTNDILSDVPWKINGKGELEPASTCDWSYLEGIYNKDQSFFLRLIGGVNVTEMEFGLSVSSSMRMTDSEFLKTAEEYSLKWYKMKLRELSPAMKAKLLGYLDKMLRISVPQVARCFGIDKEIVHTILKR